MASSLVPNSAAITGANIVSVAIERAMKYRTMVDAPLFFLKFKNAWLLDNWRLATSLTKRSRQAGMKPQKSH
jgi:hypothetical protein